MLRLPAWVQHRRMPSLTLREAQRSDFPALAEILGLTQPDWPTGAEDLQRQDDTRDPAHFALRVVAEQAGQIVGVGHVGHDDFAFEPWRYWSALDVHPDFQRQGVGTALYSELKRHLQERGAREVRTMLSSKPQDAAGRAFLERRGWRVGWERFESQLDTRDTDLSTFDGLLTGVAEQGVRLMSLAELAADPDRDRRLHELDWLLFQDVPSGLTPTKKSLDQWVKDELADPQLRPELSFVAVGDGPSDPLTGSYVGYSTIGKSRGEHYYIGMTGVLRSHRGRGLAKALKVAAMRELQAQGGGVIKTFNDTPNRAMLTMNEALGFQRTATMYRYELELS